MLSKIYIHANEVDISQKNKSKLTKLLKDLGYQLVKPDERPEMVVSIGGDGTLLTAFHLFEDQLDNLLFMGIHTGHLGFYTDWQIEELNESVKAIQKAEEAIIDYPVVSITVNLIDGRVKKILALNEVSLRSVSSTMVCDVIISDQFFETFRGDGLCIASPTGSTGLNKSLGGAVIHPSLSTLQMTEMAAVNNRVFRTLGSAIIIPKGEKFILSPVDTGKKLVLMVDNLGFSDLEIEQLEVEVASQKVRFAGYQHTDFWSRVENSFIGKIKA